METEVGVEGNDEGKVEETGVEKSSSALSSPKQIADPVVFVNETYIEKEAISHHNSRIQPPSQISLQKHPVNSGPSPANLQLQGPRHHRPTPASAGAAHSRQNQVRFLLLAGKTTQSLRLQKEEAL
ncbi:hypothetical protein CMV_001793 [Castanea mollissima]|uniref:Uncharacterized protein n=1 Tax=Castanea mollissima TaxID=60419 RepID=A0A8J4RR07_9ROSI|nr:hypothetical protein CMV_001793 [Castanea mollissima]